MEISRRKFLAAAGVSLLAAGGCPMPLPAAPPVAEATAGWIVGRLRKIRVERIEPLNPRSRWMVKYELQTNGGFLTNATLEKYVPVEDMTADWLMQQSEYVGKEVKISLDGTYSLTATGTIDGKDFKGFDV